MRNWKISLLLAFCKNDSGIRAVFLLRFLFVLGLRFCCLNIGDYLNRYKHIFIFSYLFLDLTCHILIDFRIRTDKSSRWQMFFKIDVLSICLNTGF